MRTLAQAWDSGRNHFNVLRLIAAWLVIYGHAWKVVPRRTVEGHAIVRFER